MLIEPKIGLDTLLKIMDLLEKPLISMQSLYLDNLIEIEMEHWMCKSCFQLYVCFLNRQGIDQFHFKTQLTT